MPRLFLKGGVASVALAAALGLGAADASADASVVGTVLKTKDKWVFEDISKFKVVATEVFVGLDADQTAEAEAIANQDSVLNYVEQYGADTSDAITDSVLGNRGITSVNQAAGHMNNQGTALSFAIDGLRSHDSFADANAALEQFSAENEVDIGYSTRAASLYDSVNSNYGLTAVNQATGNMANQGNAIAVAVAPKFGVALSEADLGQWQIANDVDEDYDGIVSTASMVGSVRGNSGVTAVNQSSGNMANQANVLSISVAGTL